MAAYTTPEDIRTFSALDLTGITDETLALFAQQATSAVEAYCNKQWYERNVEQERREGIVNRAGQCFLEFGVRPVISIYDILLTPFGGGQTITVPSGSYDLFSKTGYLYTHQSYGLRDEQYYYTINFSGGEMPPPDVVYATNLIAQGMLYPVIQASGGGSTGTIDDSAVVQSFKSLNYEVSYKTAATSTPSKNGKFFTPTVESILNKYKVTSQSW